MRGGGVIICCLDSFRPGKETTFVLVPALEEGTRPTPEKGLGLVIQTRRLYNFIRHYQQTNEKTEDRQRIGQAAQEDNVSLSFPDREEARNHAAHSDRDS